MIDIDPLEKAVNRAAWLRLLAEKDAEIERLKEALRWYASPHSVYEMDGGKLARRALEPKP